MKLRNKVLISLLVVWIAFLAAAYAGSHFLLTRSFLALENDRADKDLARIDQAIDQINHSLFVFTSDWAHWDDFYSYLQGKNPSFISNNLKMPVFLNSTINLLTYWNKQGKLVFSKAINTDNGKPISYPKSLKKYLYAGSLLVKQESAANEIQGYILVNDGIMMVAACAATDGDKLQPSVGTIVTGRFISPKIITQIKDHTKVDVSLLTFNQIIANPALNKIFKTISQTKTNHYHMPINDTTLEGFSLIRDVYNQPIGMFKMVAPRTIYQTGAKAIYYYLTSFILVGILFSFIILFLLHKLIIKRLEQLNHDVAEIGEKHLLYKRVSAEGNDELSSVSSQINLMLNTIQTSHYQLEQRVEKRTQELKLTNTQLEEEIAERKSIEKDLITHKEHLVRLAHYDALTDLPNRVFFHEMLNKSLNHASRHHKILAILFIDLDRFKSINDALGHTAGDQALKEIANRFSSILRTDDVLARLGGDEFIVLLNGIEHPNYASPVAEKLLQACMQPIKIKSHEFFLTASIGICIFPNDGTSLEDLQKNADMAMYKAKRTGRNNYQYFTQEMNFKAHEHMQLEAALRKALINNEFILHYQPKFNVVNGLIVAVEALIRWESPELGLISPDKFIPLAEETGLIIPIGEWALREAIRANKAWQNQGYQPIIMAVNLSPKQFHQQDIATLIETILIEANLNPNYLILEITENVVMEDLGKAREKLNTIQQMGAGIAIDDFGTGYTSINYLKQFPITVIKIDQSFIKGIPENQNDIAIVSAIIALAHSLKIKVVAEGVETAEQLQFLAEQRCDIVQGYYLSKPLPEDKLLALLPKAEGEHPAK